MSPESLSDFEMAALWTRVLTLDPRIRIIEVSCKTGTRAATLKNSS